MECRDKIKHYISNITAMSGGKVDINISDIDTTNIEIALQQILEQVATLIKQNAPEDLTIKANELLLNYQLKSELYLQEKVEYINYDIKKIDLYLPSLASNYHYDKNKQQFILEDRKERLHHESENIDHFIQGFVKKGFNGSGKKLAFIEGSPGSGKTMFSQKFAFENVLAYFDENNKEVDFLPIYVRLRDWKETPPYEKYTTILSDSEVFLKRLVSNTFKTKGLSPAQKNKESDALDKLEDNDIRGKKVVFILDGLDEMELQGSQDSQDFIQEVSDFLGYFNNPEDQNQNFLTIITGRPFQNKINKKLANKIDWYYLDGFKYYKNKKEQVLDKKNEWAKNYDKCNNLSIEGKNSFQNFITNLKNSEVYKKNKGIQSIFSEPFIIFNIAKLVLENKLKVEDLQANASYVRILIYEKVIFETIQKSREQDQKNDLFEGKIDLKYEFIQKLATGIFNVNGEQAKIGVIKERISRGKDSLNSVLQKITCPEEVKRIEQNQDLTNEEKEQQKKDVYNQNFKKIKDDNLLSFFYFKHDPNPDDFWDSNIEFAHKSFGEFLQAREIWQTLFNLKKLIKNFDEENLNHLSKTKIEDLKWEKVLEHSELSEKIYKILYNLLSGRAMTEKTIVYEFWIQMLELSMKDAKKDGGFFITKEDIEKVENNQFIDLKNNCPENISEFYSQFLTADYQFVFDALQSFYREWSNRGFINELPDKNLIIKYQKNVDDFYKNKDLESLQTLRIDVTTGINVLLILLKFNQQKRKIENQKSKKIALLSKFKDLPLLNLGIKPITFKQNWYYLDSFELDYNKKYLGYFLKYSVFSGANFKDLNLDDLDLSNSKLDTANLKNTSLNNTNLNNADMWNTDLENVKNVIYVKNFDKIKVWQGYVNKTNNPWAIKNINDLPPEAQQMMEKWQETNGEQF